MSYDSSKANSGARAALVGAITVVAGGAQVIHDVLLRDPITVINGRVTTETGFRRALSSVQKEDRPWNQEEIDKWF